MTEETKLPEYSTDTDIDIQDFVKKLNPEILQILYGRYGSQLEKLHSIDYLYPFFSMGRMLERVLRGSALEQKVILLKYGILTGEPVPRKEIGDRLGMTYERVCMLERKIKRVPCCLKRRKRLKDYLDD